MAFESMLIAGGGLYTHQKRLDTIADNVANVNTVGYKASRMEFDEAMYTATVGGQKGHGATVSSTNRSFTQGSIETTDQPLDFALEGDGFFQIQDNQGNILYTRAGNFYTSVEGNSAYLVTAQGYYVLDENGQRIEIPEGTQSISVNDTGQLSFILGDDEEPVTAQFGLYTFTNKYGLLSVGENNFQATEASGGAIVAGDVTVHQGALESSNVDLSSEMVSLIRAQRTFSLVSRALTTADEMEGVANNMR